MAAWLPIGFILRTLKIIKYLSAHQPTKIVLDPMVVHRRKIQTGSRGKRQLEKAIMQHCISKFEKIAIVLAILTAMVVGVSQSWAHETDQFTVPDKPLADIAPEITAEMAKRIQNEMDRLNKDMEKNLPKENDPHHSSQTLAKNIATNFGTNFFQTEFESWIVKHEFKAQPSRFQVDYPQSVFNGAATTRPLLVFALSPTININGVNIGLDKIGHFVQQGHQYYDKYSMVIQKKDATRIDALEAAIKEGIDQENGIYGNFTIGVYSNADMAANYAGLYFYINLFKPVSLGGRVFPAILELHQGKWRFADNSYPKDMFTRFVTEHLNESFNPPTLSPDVLAVYEKNVRKLAPDWVKFYQSSQDIEAQRNLTLSRWYGEAYGYAGPDNCPTISRCYFEEEVPKSSWRMKTAKADKK